MLSAALLSLGACESEPLRATKEEWIAQCHADGSECCEARDCPGAVGPTPRSYFAVDAACFYDCERIRGDRRCHPRCDPAVGCSDPTQMCVNFVRMYFSNLGPGGWRCIPRDGQTCEAGARACPAGQECGPFDPTDPYDPATTLRRCVPAGSGVSYGLQ